MNELIVRHRDDDLIEQVNKDISSFLKVHGYPEDLDPEVWMFGNGRGEGFNNVNKLDAFYLHYYMDRFKDCGDEWKIHHRKKMFVIYSDVRWNNLK